MCLVELDRVEEGLIAERAEQLTFQGRTEVDLLASAVVEPQGQRVRANNIDLLNAAEMITSDHSGGSPRAASFLSSTFW